MSDGIFNFNRPRYQIQIEPRMTDESGGDFETNQSRASDQGSSERRDPGADALSELARLIGQTDRFTAAPGRTDEAHKSDGRIAGVSRSSPSAARDTFTRPPAWEPAQAQDRSRDDRPYRDQSYRDQSFQESHEDQSREDRFRQHQSFEGRSYGDRSSFDKVVPVRSDPDFARSRLPVQPTDHSEADHSETTHDADSFDFLQLPSRDEYPVAPRHTLADEGDYDHRDRREDQMGGRRHPGYGRQHEEYAGEYDEFGQDGDSEYETDHDDSHDGGPAAKRRSTTKVVFAVLGLAVFGSAAAFGYRTIFKAAPSDPTPIIRADNSPTKVMPAASDASPRPASGPFGERSGEQLVRRDEDPVDVGASYRSGSADAAGSAGSSPSGIVPATVGPASPGDPRRVRTVTIRTDQGAASSDRTAASRSAQPPQPQTAPPPVRQAAAPPAPKASGAPLAVVPDAEGSRVPDAGGFVVQVSAQRSEAEAQAAFRTLQTKYSVLNGRQPLIRRKDQGERGIFYAAQVGPFGVKSDADQLCETLKSAGGACFVQRN